MVSVSLGFPFPFASPLTADDPGDPPAADGWLVDLDGDGFDEVHGFWIGAYEGLIKAEFIPDPATGLPGAVPAVFWTAGLPFSWPDGGPDTDGDRLSDAFEHANSGSDQVWNGFFDEQGNFLYDEVPWGTRADSAFSDGDPVPDGIEVLELTPRMRAAGLVPFDPLVDDTQRDDDTDGLTTLDEYFIYGTSFSSPDTDQDTSGDAMEINNFTDPLNPLDPPPPGTAGGTGDPAGTGAGVYWSTDTSSGAGRGDSGQVGGDSWGDSGAPAGGGDNGGGDGDGPPPPPPVFTVMGRKHDLAGGQGTLKVPATDPTYDEDYRNGMGHTEFQRLLGEGYEVVWHDAACEDHDHDSTYDGNLGGGGYDPTVSGTAHPDGIDNDSDGETDEEDEATADYGYQYPYEPYVPEYPTTPAECSWSVRKLIEIPGTAEVPATGVAFTASRFSGSTVEIDSDSTVASHYESDPPSPFSGTLDTLGFDDEDLSESVRSGLGSDSIESKIEFYPSSTMAYPIGNSTVVWVHADRPVESEQKIIVPITAFNGTTETTVDAIFTIAKDGQESTSVSIEGAASVYATDLGNGCVELLAQAVKDQTTTSRAGDPKPTFKILEVSFSGQSYHQLISDDGATVYHAPHWADRDGDGSADTESAENDPAKKDRNVPVAFTRKTRPTISAKFRATSLPSGQSVKIRATQGALQIPETDVTPAADGTITLPPTESTTTLPDEVCVLEPQPNPPLQPAKINWEIDSGSGFEPVKSTSHKMYLTLAAPHENLPKNRFFESVFHISCTAGNGAKDSNTLFSNVWNAIATKEVKDASGNVLAYWANTQEKAKALNSIADAKLLNGLLRDKAGTCSAWTELTRSLLLANGSNEASETTIWPMVKPALKAPMQQQFDAANAATGGSYNATDLSIVVKAGLEGQGPGVHIPAARNFNNHVLIKFGENYYDPSYGTGPFKDIIEWEKTNYEQSIYRFTGTGAPSAWAPYDTEDPTTEDTKPTTIPGPVIK